MYLIDFYTILLYSHFLPIICRGLPSFLLKYSIKISHRSKAGLKGDIGNGSVCSYQQFFCPANPDKILVFYKGFANHFLKQPAKMVIAHTGYFSGCCYGQLGFNMLLHVINYRFDPL